MVLSGSAYGRATADRECSGPYQFEKHWLSYNSLVGRIWGVARVGPTMEAGYAVSRSANGSTHSRGVGLSPATPALEATLGGVSAL